MPVLNFKSVLASQIENFITLRRVSGTDYTSQSQILGYFDLFLIQQGVNQPRLTRRIIETYQQSLLHLAPRTQVNRFSVIRNFCQYLAKADPQNYIPEPMRTILSINARQPYIFTYEEIRALMTAALKLAPTGSLRPHTYHTLLGLLYCTGIRIGEAIRLNLGHFHEPEQALYIAAGKFQKDRWILLSDSTCQKILDYLHHRLRIHPRLPDSPLFINLRSRRFGHATIYQAFRFLLAQCRIPHHKQKGPRLHDLRHTFAVHRLLAWYRSGENVNAKLPALATYMGHVNINSTRVYLRPTAEMLEQVNLRFHNYYLENIKHEGGKP